MLHPKIIPSFFLVFALTCCQASIKVSSSRSAKNTATGLIPSENPLAPNLNITEGEFSSNFTVEVAQNAVPDSDFIDFRYTLDGTDPSCGEGLSTNGPISISGTADVTLKVIACDAEGNASAITIGIYHYKIVVSPAAPSDGTNFKPNTSTGENGSDSAPVLSPVADQTIFENSPITQIDIGDSGKDLDADGDSITYTCFYDGVKDNSVPDTNLCGYLTGFAFNSSNGIVNWTPDFNQAGIYEFKITGSEGNLQHAIYFTITVTNLDRPPQLTTIANQVTAENSPIATVDAGDGGDDLDVDNDVISYTCYYDNTDDDAVADTNLCSSLSGISFSGTTGIMNWTPNFDQAGEYEFKIVGSALALQHAVFFTITVTNTDRAPVLTGINDQSTTETVAITQIDVGDNGDDFDADGDPISYTCYYDTSDDDDVSDTNLCVTLSGVSFDSNSGTMNWTPGLGQAGVYEFKITGSEGDLEHSIFITITVTIPFVSTWNTNNTSVGSSGVNQIKLPLVSSGTYNFLVDWGDGQQNTITAWNDVNATHTYGAAGVKTITISGTIVGWRFANTGDRQKITGIGSWGPLRLGNANGYFHGASNLTITATDNLDLTGTTILYRVFRECTSLTTVPSMNSWNFSAVTDLREAFHSSPNFNQNIGSINTGNVTNMSSMFQGASIFNQNIGGWNVGSVTNFSLMFYNAAAFNQNIGSWNVSAATNVDSMFYNAAIFNQNLNSWNVSNVSFFTSMFYNAVAFAGNITGWTPTSATNMSYMFFNADSFNQDISSWNVATVTNMNSMFRSNNLFNQNIGGWNVANVTTMANLFDGAVAFNQNIGGWNVRKVTSMASMFSGVTLSTPNYDALLNGWDTLGGLSTNVSFHGGNSQYSTAASAARANLISTYTWTIADGGAAP